MADVVLDHVTKVFPGNTVAVDDVSLTVLDGEFMVLVGPSGCGKSTVLRMVAGLEDLTSGSVSIGGRLVTYLPPKDRDIAMVFQNYALYPHMTVEDNLSFALRLRKEPRQAVAARVAETATVLGLDEYLGRKPAALSGGQRQRVAMGRAIVRRPKVFLMDEPLSNLDAKLRVAMRGELSRLHRTYQTTTLYVTHDQVEAMTLGHRIAVLDRGRLQQVGTPEEVYGRPRNIFVAGFIGSPAMNLVRARVAAHQDGLVLVVGDHRWPVPRFVTAHHPTLRDFTDREVVVGLRPGDLDLVTAATAADAPRLRCRATTVEALGSERNVLFPPPGAPPLRIGEDEAATLWTARIEGSAPVHTGDSVEFVLDLAGAHYFDPESTEALPTGAAAVAAPVPVPSGACLVG
jgi:multiple sugar transport system ATP-binding protein